MATNTKELKSLLHESIENIDDEGFLQTVKDILDQKYEPQKGIQPTPYQEKRVAKAKESINSGNFLTSNQADEMVSKWLSE